jgi:acyl-coenzyme A synthetase/AMP-(fatty) acid ligase
VPGDVAVNRFDVHGHPDPVFFLGYWKNPAATRRKFTGDWCRTGDLATRDADGYLWYQGRADDVFKASDLQRHPHLPGHHDLRRAGGRAQVRHAILDRAIERGINFIDTAEMYAVPPRAETYGATETIIGRWLASRPGMRAAHGAGQQGGRPGARHALGARRQPPT